MMADEISRLLALAESGDWTERVRAVTDLGERSEAEARTAVAVALYDADNTAVTEAAVAGLVRRGDDAAREALLDALRSDDNETADHVYGFLDCRAGQGSAFAQSVLDEYLRQRQLKAH